MHLSVLGLTPPQPTEGHPKNPLSASPVEGDPSRRQGRSFPLEPRLVRVLESKWIISARFDVD
jgi:hypothetical protein